MAKTLSAKQKETLVDFIYERPEMYKGTFSPTYTHTVSVALWKQLTAILNAIPGGANKEWKQWRKTWVDLKKQVKNKKNKQKQHSSETGGGPPLPPPLETVDKSSDEKIFEIITPVAFEGNKDVPEPSFFSEEFLIVDDKNTPTIDMDTNENTNDTTNVAGTSSLSNGLDTRIRSVTRKKITKSSKLEKSLRNNQLFLNVSQKGIESTDLYRERKLEVMKQNLHNKENYYKAKIEAVKSYYNNKTHYYKEKIQVLKNISNSVGQIAADVNYLQVALV